MKLLSWLRQVTSARHFFIFVTFAIALLCLYIYTFIFGSEALNLSSLQFYLIIAVFLIHLLWIFTSTIIHFIKKEWKPAIIKGILCVLYIMLIYFIYNFSTSIFYDAVNAIDYKVIN